MKLTGREKLLLIALAIILAGFAYYRLVFLPESNNIKKLQVTYKTKMELYNQSSGSKAKIAEIEEEISKIDSDIDRIQKGTSRPIRVPELLEELSKKAEKCGVTLNNIKFSGDAGAVKGSYKGETGKEDASEVQDLLNSLKGTQDKISETIPAQSQNTQAQSAQTASEGKKSALGLRILEMSFDINGTYEKCTQLLRFYEENTRLYIVEDFNIKGSANNASGNIKLLTYALAESDGYQYDVGTSGGRVIPLPEAGSSSQTVPSQSDSVKTILDDILQN